MNKKKSVKLISLAITICVLVVLSLSSSNKEAYFLLGDSSQTIITTSSNFSSIGENQNYSPQLGKTFIGFKEKLGFKESQNDYFIVNNYGYLGKYQFGKSTLSLLGITDTKAFLKTPELQEKAFVANAERNKWVLRKDIKRFSGKYISGVKITESGILAAAHLAGPGSVKKYLRSYGENGFSDAFGTSIRSYMKRFQGYDTSYIKPNRRAKVSIRA